MLTHDGTYRTAVPYSSDAFEVRRDSIELLSSTCTKKVQKLENMMLELMGLQYTRMEIRSAMR